MWENSPRLLSSGGGGCDWTFCTDSQNPYPIRGRPFGLTQGRPCHPRGSEVFRSLAWPCPCHECSSIQGCIHSPQSAHKLLSLLTRVLPIMSNAAVNRGAHTARGSLLLVLLCLSPVLVHDNSVFIYLGFFF